MTRHDTIIDITYSYYLEKMQSTLCGRIDRFLSFLTLFLGAAIFADFHGTIIYGGIIAIIASLNTVYRFGKESELSHQRAQHYLLLKRNKESLSDEQLNNELKNLEKDDGFIFSVLCNAAQQRSTIVLGLRDNPAIKLTTFEKIISWLAGNLPNQSEYLANNTGPYPLSETESNN